MKRRRVRPVDPVDLFFQRVTETIHAHLEGYLQEQSQPVEVSEGIPPEMFRKLISLCHPDKHGNSPTSQEVTCWLLEQREQ